MNSDRKSTFTIKAPIAAGIAAILSMGAQAQTLMLEEVVVTAQNVAKVCKTCPFR